MIDAIIQRLRSSCPTLKHVAGAVDFAEISEGQGNVPLHLRPAAYVMLVSEQAEANQAAAGHTVQVVAQRVGLAIVVGGGEQAAQVVAKDAVKAVHDAIMDCLLGWSPDDAGPLVFSSFKMAAFAPRAVWFEMTFGRDIGLSSAT